MLFDEIKKQALAAMKGGRTIEKEVLRVVMGEVTVSEGRGVEITDAMVQDVVRKLVKSNNQTAEMSSSAEQKAQLAEENAVLEALLPKGLSADDVAALLAPVADAIKAAANDGQATGVAMKHLKTASAKADGKVVSDAVKKLRAG